jgi:hypothetical protein
VQSRGLILNLSAASLTFQDLGIGGNPPLLSLRLHYSATLGDIGRFDISVRCFNTNGIKFQKSKFIGSGRHTTPDDLLESLESVERYVVVDLRQFPLLRFYPIDSKLLLRLVRQGKLTASGITSKRFDAWIEESFSTITRSISLGRETGALG